MQAISQSPVLMKVLSDAELIVAINSELTDNKKRLLQIEFYRRFKNYIYKNALNVCRNFADSEQLAQELTQETFIYAFKALANFKLPANESDQPYFIKAWLGRIGNNCFKKLYAKRLKDVVFDSELIDQNEPSYDLFEQLFGDSHSEVMEAPTNELIIKLQEALNALPDRAKHILFVYVDEGCINSKIHLSQDKLDELCKLYDTTSENIRQIKKRTLEKIKSICFS